MAETQKKVHYIQEIYRKLITCFSKPGSIEVLPFKEDQNFEFESALGKPMLSIALLLLDREVTHKIAGAPDDEYNAFVKLTYSIHVENDADYIFICRHTKNETAEKCIAEAKIGNLVDPQKSATVIFETEDLCSGEKVELHGPGIKDFSVLTSTCPSWLWEIREKKNSEFPLGIDIILLDTKGRIAAIPRTTKINNPAEQINGETV